MSLPEKLKIGGHIWTVLYPYTFVDNDGLSAQCDPNRLELRIGAANQQESVAWVSLLHEMLHAIDKQAGFCKLEEIEKEEDMKSYVDGLAEGIWQVLVDNNLLKKPK